MSEAEKRRRAEYKVQRNKRILIQTVVIAALLLGMLISVITYFQLNKNYYITYSESSSVGAKVYLKENDFYEEEFLPEGMTYVTELIDKVSVNFMYCMDMQAEDVSYDYSYSVTATVVVNEKSTGRVIFTPEFEIVPEQRFSRSSGGVLKISENVEVVYDTYDKVACDFINVYKLSEAAVAHLELSLNVKVLSKCDDLAENSQCSYYTTYNIPLAAQTAEANVYSSAPNGESHVLACPSALNANLFKVLAIVFGILAGFLIGFLIVFVYMTRNNDINYSIKVKKIVQSYKSYIQQIKNEFDREGYQILNLTTFSEMLDIRDTIQSPVLMYENEDKTRTEFLIPTNTRILYMFEIKVSDYDEIYAAQITDEPVADEPVADEPVADEPVADEPVADEPAADEPVADEPVADEPAADEPVADEPVADEPVADEPVADEPVADEPVADEPVADEPVADEPVADEPVADEPVADEPVADEPAEMTE